jgi:hypothetical protein
MTYARCVTLTCLVAALGECSASSPHDPARQKPRVVVTTDLELDDASSLIRYLLYSTDFRTEGLIYASSGFHWKGDGSGKKPSVPNREYSRWGLNLCPCESWRWAPDERFIDLAVDTYAQVYPNLRVHDSSYPTPAGGAGGAGDVALGYGAQATASAENAVSYSTDWTRENVSSRGPLGALYRV